MQRNHCCLAETLNITYSECVSVALVIKHVKRMRHIVLCGLSGTTIFFSIISYIAQIAAGGSLNV